MCRHTGPSSCATTKISRDVLLQIRRLTRIILWRSPKLQLWETQSLFPNHYHFCLVETPHNSCQKSTKMKTYQLQLGQVTKVTRKSTSRALNTQQSWRKTLVCLIIHQLCKTFQTNALVQTKIGAPAGFSINFRTIPGTNISDTHQNILGQLFCSNAAFLGDKTQNVSQLECKDFSWITIRWTDVKLIVLSHHISTLLSLCLVLFKSTHLQFLQPLVGLFFLQANHKCRTRTKYLTLKTEKEACTGMQNEFQVRICQIFSKHLGRKNFHAYVLFSSTIVEKRLR